MIRLRSPSPPRKIPFHSRQVPNSPRTSKDSMTRLLIGVGAILLLLLMAAVVLTYAAPRFGWRVDLVSSNSMSPVFKRGALVVVRPVEPAIVEIGDIIVFYPETYGENPVGHRVVSVDKGPPLQFRTKGDASAEVDSFKVSAQNLAGRVVFSVPLLGWVAKFLRTVPGLMLGLFIPGLLLLGMLTRDVKMPTKVSFRAWSGTGRFARIRRILLLRITVLSASLQGRVLPVVLSRITSSATLLRREFISRVRKLTRF